MSTYFTILQICICQSVCCKCNGNSIVYTIILQPSWEVSKQTSLTKCCRQSVVWNLGLSLCNLSSLWSAIGLGHSPTTTCIVLYHGYINHSCKILRVKLLSQFSDEAVISMSTKLILQRSCLSVQPPTVLDDSQDSYEYITTASMKCLGIPLI